jgi:hypothetical protein
MKLPAWVAGEPLSNRLMLVGLVVVEDDLDFLARISHKT